MVCSHITKSIDSSDYVDSLAKKSKKHRFTPGLTSGFNNPQMSDNFLEKGNFIIPEIEISFQTEESSFDISSPPIADDDLLSLLE